MTIETTAAAAASFDKHADVKSKVENGRNNNNNEQNNEVVSNTTGSNSYDDETRTTKVEIMEAAEESSSSHHNEPPRKTKFQKEQEINNNIEAATSNSREDGSRYYSDENSDDDKYNKEEDGDAYSDSRGSTRRRGSTMKLENVSRSLRKSYRDDSSDSDDYKYLRYDTDADDDFDLERDIYSLWFCSDIKSTSFLFCFCVFLIQVAILVLMLVDLLSDDDRASWEEDPNPFNVPVDVETTVAVAQFLALIVAVGSQDDVLLSFDALFVAIYDQRVVEEAGVPHASLAKWRFFNIMRLLEGYMTLAVSLLIVVQTDNTLDIFLNFAAVEFVSELDNVAYSLAKTGFLGYKIKRKTDRVRAITFQRDRSFCKSLAIQASFLGTLLALIVAWVSVYARQKRGFFLERESCNTINVEFGNEVFDLTLRMEENNLALRMEGKNESSTFSPLLHYSYFSGQYTAVKRGVHRPVYYERGHVGDPHAGKFYYCEVAKSWVFTIPALQSVIPQRKRYPGSYCDESWLLQSPMTSAFTLETVSGVGWNIIAGSGRIRPAEDLSLTCGECSRDTDCSLNGNCTHGLCECDDGWSGRACNLRSPACNELVWIDSGESSEDYFEYYPFDLMKQNDGKYLEIHERPVYKLTGPYTDSWSPDDGSSKLHVVVGYSGRRWFGSLQNDTEVEMFKNGYHPYWGMNVSSTVFRQSNYTQPSVRWYSAPTDSETPTGFSWYEISDTGSRGNNVGMLGITTELNARFECTTNSCRPDVALGTCGDLGRCIEDSETNNTKCVCDRLSSGWFCEYTVNSDYVKKQTGTMVAILENSTNYTEFIEDLTNATLKNEFYDRYFDYQILEYFSNGQVQTWPEMNASRYATLPEDDADRFRRLTRRVAENSRSSPVNLKFRL